MTHNLPKPPESDPAWAWFLDVDGTLIDIAPTPSAVNIPQQLPPLLARLSQCHGGALAVVSGRSLDNLRLLLTPFDPPAAGLHGLECRDAGGGVVRAAAPPGLDDIRTRLTRTMEECPGLLLEDKGLALALHFRQAPEREETARRAVAAAVADHPGFTVLAGKMVFEIKPAGVNKGSAIRSFMTQPPFSRRRPVFVGDDVTDEDGFIAANDLGGLSVLVGPPRDTAAMFRLDDIESCRVWLALAAGTVWNSQMGEGAD
ncbi:MAG: trehalose-phosphatase [Rhodospirillaceae bacterium]|nr:trehalose-phosphatase [Rhodospirillales bacterium]